MVNVNCLLKKLIVMLLLVLTACAVPQPTKVINTAAVGAVNPDEEMKQHLRVLLYQAQLALSEGRLTYPAENNAYRWYQYVLALDSESAEAKLGLQDITSRYLVLAEKAFVASTPERAEVLLKRALAVTATPEQVNTLRQRYTDRKVLLIEKYQSISLFYRGLIYLLETIK